MFSSDEDDPDVFDEDIDSAFTEYRTTGNGLVLFETMRRCVQYGKPLPGDVWAAFMACLDKYNAGEARTLDEAFGVSRPKGWNQSAAKSRSRKTGAGISCAGAVYLAVIHRNLNGRAIDDELFEEIASEYHISASTARNFYREVKANLEKQQGQEF